ncbi:MAG: zinc ribbon domain-containing protein [Anaerolineae bacterium]|nr:zinc ribbon domain-containing protein [Anaerolineae bacterium]
MAELLGTFRRKAEDLVGAINRQGGISATIASLRRQMEISDRRRAISKVKSDLQRLDRQITEMITAVGVQAVGLHKAGRLSSPELQPLCAHIVELESAVARQKAELATLETQLREETASDERICPSCGKLAPESATFCPYCGGTLPAQNPERFCVDCGASLRAGARFCARCGHPVGGTSADAD